MKCNLGKKRIGILGAESTGKSVLAEQLANAFNGVYVPEYAREYVENLSYSYRYEDVEKIARKQIEQLQAEYVADFVVFDTELIITKVWFEDKYGKVPDWLETAIREIRLDACLLCMPDLPFVDDPVRENPNRRQELTKMYEEQLQHYHIPYGKVFGQNEERLKNAIDIIIFLTTNYSY